MSKDKHFTRIHRDLTGKTFFASYSSDDGSDAGIPEVCHCCIITADFYCDYPIGNGKTCDKPICLEHRTPVAFERDYCPTHAMETYAHRLAEAKSRKPPSQEDQDAWMERYADELLPRAINVKTQDTRNVPFVYVGRGRSGDLGRFGNPIRFGKICQFCGGLHHDGPNGRRDLIKCYKKHLWSRIREDWSFRRDVRDLKKEFLGCHCAPLACHADVLAECCLWLWSPMGLYHFPMMEEAP